MNIVMAGARVAARHAKSLALVETGALRASIKRGVLAVGSNKVSASLRLARDCSIRGSSNSALRKCPLV
jgi:hypothetical protein